MIVICSVLGYQITILIWLLLSIKLPMSIYIPEGIGLWLVGCNALHLEF